MHGVHQRNRARMTSQNQISIERQNLSTHCYPKGFDFIEPDYLPIYKARLAHFEKLKNDYEFFIKTQEHYKNNPVAFINDVLTTYDPRVAAAKDRVAFMPFVLMPRQVDLIEWLHGLMLESHTDTESDALVEKTRDCGLSWLCCAFGAWAWLYVPGSSIGYGSLKASSTDTLGNPKSLLEKVRIILRTMPPVLLPKGYEERKHALHMKIVNPITGSIIAGESGDNIGRGDRTLMYFKDEAQPLTSNILTPTGWTTMGEIKLGNHVVGANGLPTTVIGINDAGKHPVYTLTFSDGSTVCCSPNHKWTVDKGIIRSRRKRVTLTTQEMVKDFYSEWGNGKREYRYRLPMNEPVRFDSPKQLPLDPYIVGALLGDGYVAGMPNKTIELTSGDPWIPAEVSKLLPPGCELRQSKSSSITYRLCNTAGRCNITDEKGSKLGVVNRLVTASGIAGKRSWEKFIPNSYKTASIEDRLSMLQGLMDTDGSAANSIPTFHTSSLQLAEDVIFIVRSLGGMASHKVYGRPGHYRDSHTICVSLPDDQSPFRLPRKKDKLKPRQHVLQVSLMGFTISDPEEVRCITVENEDGLYLTDDFIVTHNSAHYEHAEMIEASLSANSNCKIDVSSVNGPGNLFYTKRHSLPEANVFIYDWSDDLRKSQAWYDRELKKYKNAGIEHIFYQEIGRDYSAAVAGLFIPAKWVQAAVNYPLEAKGIVRVALDVADDVEMGDTNALGYRIGNVVNSDIGEWGGEDTNFTSHEALMKCIEVKADEFVFDRIGVGAGVHSEFKRFETEGINFNVAGFVANATVFEPHEDYAEGVTNEELFDDIKAQATFNVRRRCEKCYLNKFEGGTYPDDELISLPNNPKLLMEMSRPKRQPGRKAKIRVEPKDKMKKRGLKSPNLLDMVVMLYAELDFGDDLRFIMV